MKLFEIVFAEHEGCNLCWHFRLDRSEGILSSIQEKVTFTQTAADAAKKRREDVNKETDRMLKTLKVSCLLWVDMVFVHVEMLNVDAGCELGQKFVGASAGLIVGGNLQPSTALSTTQIKLNVFITTSV